MAKRRTSVKNHRENGIALITALLVLLLISSLVLGLTWLTVSDQKLGSNYSGRQSDFYIAESGLEDMTARLAADFNNNYNLSTNDINNIMTSPPPLPGGYTYWDPNNPGNNGYMISYPQNAANNNAPLASYETILSGPYTGLVAELTPYTLEVTSLSPYGSETKLKRTVQTAAIPIFQFGIFSQTDLSFFAGPNFDFGGRVHTNGNLWLAENGGTLTMENKVTAVGEVIRTNLENGTPTTSSYNTTVDITTNPGSGNYVALTTSQGSTTGNSYYGDVSTSYWAGFPNLADNTYNGNLGSRETGVTVLDVGIATPSLGGQPIDEIRPPVVGEDANNPNKLAERYYSQASVRILLADYGPSGGCKDSDITLLPEASAGAPVDLATLSWDTTLSSGFHPNVGDSSVSPPPYNGAPTTAPNTNGLTQDFLPNVGVNVFPLPVSGATPGVTTYTSTNGYWVQGGFPIETGCLKIDYQAMAGGAFSDITWMVLSYGYTGRNINPSYSASASAPLLVALPLPNNTANQVNAQGPEINAGVNTIGCTDLSPQAIIRFARVRDNPIGETAASCGYPASSAINQRGEEFWPNVLFDTREGTLRDTTPTQVGNYYPVTLAGAMHYVELDVANLSQLLTNSAVINNTTGYSIYFSDRRGDHADPNIPASAVGSPSNKTGGYGYEDIINPGNAATGCPNNTLDVLGTNTPAEDVEADINPTNGYSNSPVLRLYGNTLYPPSTLALPSGLWLVQNTGTQIGTVANLITGSSAVLTPNSNCTAPTGIPAPYTQWPFAFAAQTQDLRENPPIFFRRALKLVDGGALATSGGGIFGTCNGVSCGLTVVSENPVYVQGDYNDANLDNTFASTSPHIACSVVGDAVSFLSDNWNDVNSFIFPYGENGAITNGGRNAVTTMYRTAIIGGKGIPFLQPAGTAADFGTDGGMHNFLRYLENWGGSTLYYHGSVVSLYYNHQASGVYKCCNTVYSPPNRGYKFDTDFETPSLLPPRTPMLRAINTIGFTQVIIPTQ
jgi:hypothetical protein